jgi:murein DD-endopeptidase MepM/ murein hydrolase activator NlpD
MSRKFVWWRKHFLVRLVDLLPLSRRGTQVKDVKPPFWLKETCLRGRRFLTRPLTLLLVPPRGTQVKDVKLPLWLAAAGGLIVSALLLISVFACVRAVQLQGEMAELTRLRRVNAEQGLVLQSLQQEAQKDRTSLQEIGILEQKVRAMVGLGSSGQASRAEPAGGTSTQRAMLLGAIFRPALSTSAVAVDLQGITQDTASSRQGLETLQQNLDAHFRAINAMPDHWPVNGPITSPFGIRQNPFGGDGTEFHTGIDIAAPYGTSVEAAGAGVVVFVGYKPAYGTVITVDHGNGYQTSYCHLSGVCTTTGKRVQKGEVIGRVGTEGRSTGPHLHFGVTLNGVLINPQPLLK